MNRGLGKADLVDELERSVIERRLSFGFLVLVIGLSLFDIAEDVLEGEPLSHLGLEGGFFLLAILGAFYLSAQAARLERRNKQLVGEVKLAQTAGVAWREQNQQLLQGLGAAIDAQFSTWGLSSAEKDIGLLLLKGLSHKEIGVLRNTSDRTVRQQAACVYDKSGLDGRAQLSAFFLEDVLLPTGVEVGQVAS